MVPRERWKRIHKLTRKNEINKVQCTNPSLNRQHNGQTRTNKYTTLLYTLWVLTIETWRVSIADSCTFHLNLTCRNATYHCARASIPLQHGSRGLQCRYSPLKDIVCKLRYIVANILLRNDQTISITIKYAPLLYRTGGNRKRSEQSMNAVHKTLETVFSIAICRQLGDERQSKTLF